MNDDPYKVLGVAPNATAQEIRSARTRRLRATHPDAGGDRADYDAVHRAYALVGDETSRTEYDRQRAAQAAPPPPPRWQSLWEDDAADDAPARTDGGWHDAEPDLPDKAPAEHGGSVAPSGVPAKKSRIARVPLWLGQGLLFWSPFMVLTHLVLSSPSYAVVYSASGVVRIGSHLAPAFVYFLVVHILYYKYWESRHPESNLGGAWDAVPFYCRFVLGGVVAVIFGWIPPTLAATQTAASYIPYILLGIALTAWVLGHREEPRSDRPME